MELKLLLPGSPERVLELGCGDGVLYEPLGFDRTEYTGVDFSPTMIGAFKARHPRAHLIVADADGYRDRGEYDLIFCSALVQYLDRRKLSRLLANARDMLEPTGCLVAASVPCRALRLSYYTGALSGERSTAVTSAYRIAAGLVRDGIGHWYSYGAIARLAEQHGFRSELFGSVHYPYRFHVRMTAMV